MAATRGERFPGLRFFFSATIRCLRGAVRRRLRVLALYSPAIALFAAGIVVLLTVPLYGPPQPACSCPSGEWCSCPSESVDGPHLTGPLLLAGSGIYSLIVFVIRDAKFARRAAPPRGLG